MTESTNPTSPYGVYNGQARSCLYQPTEIALIAKGLTRVSAIFNHDTSRLHDITCENNPYVYFHRRTKTQWYFEPHLAL